MALPVLRRRMLFSDIDIRSINRIGCRGFPTLGAAAVGAYYRQQLTVRHDAVRRHQSRDAIVRAPNVIDQRRPRCHSLRATLT